MVQCLPGLPGLLSYKETELGGACLPPQPSAPGRKLQEDHKFKVILGYLRELEASLEYKRQGERREGEKKEREKKRGERTEEMGAGEPRRDRVADT